MAIRLLPFRQYNEHDVINLFRAGDAIIKDIPTNEADGVSAPERNGQHDNGLIVSIDSADFTKEPVEYGTDGYLGKTAYPHIGRNQYPKATPTFKQCVKAAPFGVTLRQTLTHDENGEKLLYYPQKALELNAVFPGQAVPILTRGLITVSSAGLDNSVLSADPGAKLYATDNGKFTTASSGALQVGILVGLGDRNAVGTNPDYFAGSGSTGDYAVIKLGL
tara:strand:+ start:3665 stop:4324 length:660 start_codon:yes stop_codon:yes gene_type:complete